MYDQAELSEEAPVLIDPVNEEAESFFIYDLTGGKFSKACGLDDEGRGQRTANKLTAINALETMKARGDLFILLKGVAQAMHSAKHLGNEVLRREHADSIREETAPSKEFAGFRRYFFRSHGLGQYVWAE